PGLADWYWHRKTKIEETSGTFESVTHAIMMSAVGIPVMAALFCEINALVLVTMMAGVVVHEGVSYWDVRYSSKRREIPAIEQHTHSFLEMLPFMGTSMAICLQPKQFAAIFGRGEKPRWTLAPKKPPLTKRYVAAVLAAVGAFVVLPYAEEFVRCYRVDGTILPHEPNV
ncbi:MAG: diguanylate cyclase, partial [Candidatus Eremiobacteraeota bacterium]|nr:diguanylate cyclase [Candidatus Eremiobacteraeota bacterium]